MVGFFLSIGCYFYEDGYLGVVVCSLIFIFRGGCVDVDRWIRDFRVGRIRIWVVC